MIADRGDSANPPVGEALEGPERVSEPEAPTTAPEAPESHSGEIPPRSEQNPADDGVCICGDTGVLMGAGCWACELGATSCRFCSADDQPRAYDSKGKVACVDEEACAVRDAASAVGVEGRDIPDEPEFHDDSGPAAPTAPSDENRPCSLCGSVKAERVLVTDGRLGSEDSGVYRCARVNDCTRRAALRGAREKLSE